MHLSEEEFLRTGTIVLSGNNYLFGHSGTNFLQASQVNLNAVVLVLGVTSFWVAAVI